MKKNEQRVQRQTKLQCINQKVPSAMAIFSSLIYTIGKWPFSNIINFPPVKSKQYSTTQTLGQPMKQKAFTSVSRPPLILFSSGTHVLFIPFHRYREVP